MDDDRRRTHREAPQPIATGDDPRRLRAVIVALVAVIGVLLVRPWGDGGASGPGAPNGSPAAASAATLASADPGAATAVQGPVTKPSTSVPNGASSRQVSCGAPDGWRATTVQVWPDRVLPVRSWIAIEPVVATSPGDPVIPLAPVAASRVTLIGYCAPLAVRLQPPAGATATLWKLAPSGPIQLTQVAADPVTRYRQGVLWRPAPELSAIPRAGGVTAWPPGSYVIEIASRAHEFDRWLGLEILDLERSADPRASPGASPAPGAAAVAGSAPG